MSAYDAVIVGSGPNGLAAAITLAQAGRHVLVIEGRGSIGGGTRTAELTIPGFHHDVCSAIHPLGIMSPFFRDLPLADYGLEWIVPEMSLAHPLDGGRAVAVMQSVEETAAGLGRDEKAYQRLIGPLARDWQAAVHDLMGPLRIPHNPWLYVRHSLAFLAPATWVARTIFSTEEARAVFAGQSAHSMLPLTHPATGAFGMLLSMSAHAVGWPVVRGGSQAISNALASYLVSLGGEIRCGWEITTIDELPQAKSYLFDTAPKGLLQIAGHRMPEGYRSQLESFRYNQGVFKVDWALSEPVPWTAEVCRRTATLHLGGTMEEIVASEADVWEGKLPTNPYMLVAQQSVVDPTRAPAGKHTLWGYCHAPAGSTADLTDVIERQIERFAPGFRDTIIARATRNSVEMEHYNPNYVGGDINAGVQDLMQQYTRPSLSITPYRTGIDNVYICSSSTPPGGGVHGLCGYFAAQAVLRDQNRN
jgi:phytoene dehydrogenase-like protein